MGKSDVWLAALFTASVVGGAGCQNSCCRRTAAPSCPPSPSTAAVLARPLPPGTVPGSPQMLPPPPAFRSAPPGGFQAPADPVPVAPEVRNYAPQADTAWRAPENNGARLAEPQPSVSESPSANIHLSPPEPAETKAPPIAPNTDGGNRAPSPSFPVGIPQFAPVRDRIATGLKPMLDDGLDWLQANGYRTVLHIRPPGEEDSADRKQVEKRGMTYRVLEVSPSTLSKKTVDEFNAIIADAGNQPLFVYDRDGALAGALWYLHFRTAGKESDEAARVKAARFGLQNSDASEQRTLWVAIQKLLSEMKP